MRAFGFLIAVFWLSGCADLAAPKPASWSFETGITAPQPEAEPTTGRLATPPRQAAAERPERANRGQVRAGGAMALSEPPAPPRPGEGISLTVIDAPVREFAQIIYGDALGMAFIIAPDAVGTVTLDVAQPVAPATLAQLAEAALEAAGLSVRVVAGAAVIERANARGGETAPPQAAEVAPLRALTADQALRALQPFLGAGVAASAAPQDRAVLLSGPAERIEPLARLLRLLDDTAAGGAFATLIPLRHAAAESVAQELRETLGGGDGAQAPRLVAVPRLNAILIATDDPSLLDELAAWAEVLDAPPSLRAGGYFAYPARNRPAAELARLLQSLLGRPRDAIAEGAEADGATGDDAPFALRIQGDGLDIHVLVDTGRNALLIACSDAEFARLRPILATLDAPLRQVRIEATIVEVGLSDDLRYGVRWFFENGRVSATFTDAADGALAAAFPGLGVIFDSVDARVVIDALDSVTEVEIISSPTLLTLDGRTARLQVGDQVPIVTRSAASVVDPEAPIVNQVDFRDTGVILRITPRIYADGLVRLAVSQEVSDVVETTTSGIDSPTIQQRQFESDLLVRDGETIVLGGLIRSQRSDRSTGVPVLRDVPLLGLLFRSDAETERRTELLVTITPYIGAPAAGARPTLSTR